MKFGYLLYYPLLGLLVTIFSCNPVKDELLVKKQPVLLVSNDVVTLSLDSVSPYFCSPPQLFENYANDSTYLVIKNHLLQSIDFYSLPSGNLIKRVRPEVDGPDGVGELTGFQVLNQDSILVVSHYQFSVSIIDWHAKLINKLFAPGKTVNLRVDGNKHVSIIDSILYLPFEDFTNYGTPGFTNDIKTLYHVNLNNGSFTPLVGYPSDYQENVTSVDYIKQYSIIYPDPGKNSFVISYPLCPNLVLVSHESMDSTKRAEIDGFALVKPVDFELSPPEPMNHATHFYSNFSYGKIAYDKLNKVYYRLAWHPVEELNLVNKDYDEFFENVTSKRSFSIIVLNEKFEKVGEQYVGQQHNFDPNMLFVANGGLHIYEKTDNPDQMRFRVFKLLADVTTG